MAPQTFAALLAQARAAAGLSQSELARRCGMSRDRVGNLERRGNSNPSLATLQALARALGVEVADLIPR